MASNKGKYCRLVFLAVLILFSNMKVAEGMLTNEEKYTVALEAAHLFRAARAVIAKNQSLINDPNKGDKGLTADVVIEATRENFKKATGKDLPKPDKSALIGQVQVSIMRAIKTVMDQSQSLINEKGRGFKGFLPAVFGVKVANEFSKNMAGKAFIKLTTPVNFLRKRENRPDKWENGVIEKYFKDPAYPRDKPFGEVARHNGRSGYRLLLPEYFTQACLYCHGEPRGEKDITGGKKEGGHLGDLGGSISIVIYD